MPPVTKLVGPIKTERYRDSVAWVFIGLVGDDDVRRWRLYFYFDTRSFRCRRSRLAHGDENIGHDGLFSFGRLEKPLTGKVTPMLRARLKPEHIAEAARQALKYRG